MPEEDGSLIDALREQKEDLGEALEDVNKDLKIASESLMAQAKKLIAEVESVMGELTDEDKEKLMPLLEEARKTLLESEAPSGEEED